MKYKISKKKVIEAISTEPLTYGKFFKYYNEVDNGICEVCAVGAVLRKIKPKYFDSTHGFRITHYLAAKEYLYRAYASNNFLSILSCEHESFVNDENKFNESIANLDLQRLHLLSIIEAFCPDVVEFEV